MGTVAIIAGVAISAYGTYQGLRAAEAAKKKLAEIDRMNAELAKQQIPEVVAAGLGGEKQIEREAVEFSAEQLSSFASGGIDIASAVVGEAVEGTARTAAADILQLHHNVKRDVWKLNIGIMSDLAEAQLKEREARSAGKAAIVGAGATILTGLGGLGTTKKSAVSVSGGTT